MCQIPPRWESEASRSLACSHVRGQQVALLLSHPLPSNPLHPGTLLSARKTLFLHLPLLWMQNISGARMLLNSPVC